MIHIEDKLKRTNVYIKRDNVEVDYLTKEEFEGEIDKANAKIRGIYSRINNYATEEDFNKEVEKINGEIDKINTIITDSNEAYQNGYNDGKTEGIEEQKNRLTSISITENGTYSNEDGYNKISVNVEMLPTDGGYNKGFADGEQAQKDKLKAIQVTKNGIYEDENGFASVYVDVPQNGGGGNVDFSIIGYDDEENVNSIDKINEDIAYSKEILDNWNSSITNAYGFFSSNSNLVYCPKIDTSNVTNMSNIFYNCKSLTSVPLLDTSKVTHMNYMFQYCIKLTSIPQLDTSSVNDMSCMFDGCESLTTIPLLDTSKVTHIGNMFDGCKSLTSIPQLDTSKVTLMDSMFRGCISLTSIPLLDFGKVKYLREFFGYNYINTLTDIGGFKDLKIDWNDNYGLVKCPNLTYQSIRNVIEQLYNFRSNGDSSTTRTLKIHSNTYQLLTDEDKALAVNKGWVVIC